MFHNLELGVNVDFNNVSYIIFVISPHLFTVFKVIIFCVEENVDIWNRDMLVSSGYLKDTVIFLFLQQHISEVFDVIMGDKLGVFFFWSLVVNFDYSYIYLFFPIGRVNVLGYVWNMLIEFHGLMCFLVMYLIRCWFIGFLLVMFWSPVTYVVCSKMIGYFPSRIWWRDWCNDVQCSICMFGGGGSGDIIFRLCFRMFRYIYVPMLYN